MVTKNKNGFSLVELMVTVALIGILAAIGIPSYSKFRIKAYQSEAKTQLANLYVAQKSFYLQYNSYYPSLRMVGYAPAGNTRYNVGFGSYDATVTDEPTIPAWDQMASKTICTGIGGVGTDTRCNMIFYTPNIEVASVVRQHTYVAGAVSYEEMLAKQNAPVGVMAVAQLMLLGFESYAQNAASPTAPASEEDPCSQRVDLWVDAWGIDQDKQISAKKIAPGGNVSRLFNPDSCYSPNDIVPLAPGDPPGGPASTPPSN